MTKLPRRPRNYTAVVRNSRGWWIGWIDEVPGVNCQERTCEQLVTALCIALAEVFELDESERRACASGGRDWPAWDRELAGDIQSGKLEASARKARVHRARGRTKSL
jgi:hypothetical protein